MISASTLAFLLMLLVGVIFLIVITLLTNLFIEYTNKKGRESAQKAKKEWEKKNGSDSNSN